MSIKEIFCEKKYIEFCKKIYDKYDYIISGIIFSIFPIVAFYLMEFYEHDPFVDVRQMATIFNILLFEMIGWFLYILLGRAKWAIRIVLVCSMIFGLVNHYVMLFRSTPFVPWDIFSVGTAASVASNYDFTPSKRVVIVTVIFVVLIVLAHFLNYKMKLNVKWRLLPTAIVAAILCLFVNMLQDENFQTDNYLYPFLFTPAYMTKVNGMAVTFAMDLQYMAIDKPSGYSSDKAKTLLEEYAGSTNKSNVSDNADKNDNSENSRNTNENSNSEDDSLPNIIVIMDEAFSDLSILGDFETNQDYMPFIHSLQQGNENTITGYLNVSVCGGNTADTEFEFLTGNTMAFLPTGSIPYQQYIKSETPSLASYLESLGYTTYAQHPYYASGWNRDSVYSLLGFEELSFLPDYTNKYIVRKYVSDATSFNKVIDTYENKSDDSPAFIFNVTMQNHGGYTDTYQDFTNTVTAEGLDNDALDQYLSLLKLTDSAFENLIEYFSNVDEDTMVIFFGDHQPNGTVASPILNANGIDSNNLTTEQLQLRYQVPYVIWANFDIDEATQQDTSVNYLAANALRVAGIETSDYQNFLLELEEEYPIISSVRTEVKEDASEETSDDKTNDKSDSTSGNNKDDTAEDMLDNYKILQYYRLFDWEDDD